MKTRIFTLPVFATLLVAGIFSACQSQKQEKALISISEQALYASSLSSAFDQYRFIPLETNDNTLLGRISKIVEYKDKFYIATDRKRILAFNADGSFSHRIDRPGRGPQEYTELADFDISNDRIFLLDHRKVLIYTLTGEFIKRIDLSCNTLNLQVVGSDLLIRSNKESLFYRVETGSGKCLDLRIGIKESTRLSEENCFKSYADGYLMQQGFSNSFYRIAADFTIGEIELLDDDRLFDAATEESYLHDYGSDYDSKTGDCYIGGWAGWSEQILCRIQRNPTYEIVEYVAADLATKKAVCRLSSKCTDDISYMGLPDLIRFVGRGASKEQFITYLRPDELRKAILRHGDDGSEHSRWMKEHLLDRLHDDDNPVLFIFRFKAADE